MITVKVDIIYRHVASTTHNNCITWMQGNYKLSHGSEQLKNKDNQKDEQIKKKVYCFFRNISEDKCDSGVCPVTGRSLVRTPALSGLGIMSLGKTLSFSWSLLDKSVPFKFFLYFHYIKNGKVQGPVLMSLNMHLEKLGITDLIFFLLIKSLWNTNLSQ